MGFSENPTVPAVPQTEATPQQPPTAQVPIPSGTTEAQQPANTATLNQEPQRPRVMPLMKLRVVTNRAVISPAATITTATTTTTTPIASQHLESFVGRLVHLQSVASGQQLRILENGLVDGKGMTGPWATFLVHRLQPGLVKLQNVANPRHYLRINPEGQLDGLGVGGKWCVFQVDHHMNNGSANFSLRSHEHLQCHQSRLHVGILPDGQPKPPQQTGCGPHGSFFVIPVQAEKENKYRVRMTVQLPIQSNRWCWKEEFHGEIPEGAVEGGQEASGEKLYVARVWYRGGYHPAKVGRHLHGARFAYGDKEWDATHYQVLCSPQAPCWQKVLLSPTSTGASIVFPEKSVLAGHEANKTDQLYVARALIGGGLHCGKVGKHLGCAHIPFGGKACLVHDFELLLL